MKPATFEKKISKLQFVHCHGTVVQQETLSDTYVSGGGSNLAGTRLNDVTSRVVKTKSFWIRNDKGQEDHFEFTNTDFSIREGHEVTLVGAHTGNLDDGDFIYLINHTTGQKVWRMDAREVNAKFGFHRLSTFGRFLLHGIVGFIFAAAMPSLAVLADLQSGSLTLQIMLASMPAYWIVMVAKATNKKERFIKLLDEHLHHIEHQFLTKQHLS